MIGYQSKIKNVSFFSKVADMAAEKNLPYEFVWVGGEGGGMKDLYHSPHVKWIGDQEHVMDTLNSIDVLLFTSYSDTFGLVLAEALFKGKRIVSYVENGLAPFIEQLEGCRIFKTFDESLVLNQLQEVLSEAVNINKYKELAAYLCSMENFEKRFDELFSL
jgi:glycosyltransferase involved in cell wall biosynthesis